MNERRLSYQLGSYLRAHLAQAVVIKHADRATLHVPDLSVSWSGGTCWVEVKALRSHAEASRAVRLACAPNRAQLAFLAKLALQTEALLAVFQGTGRARKALVVRPGHAWRCLAAEEDLGANLKGGPFKDLLGLQSQPDRGLDLIGYREGEPGQAFETVRETVAWCLTRRLM